VLQKLNQYISKHKLFNNSDQLALAISGGKDSVFAAHMLNTLEVPFCMVHVNFRLRGLESEEDLSFIRALAEKLPHCKAVYTKEENTAVYAEKRGLSIQEAAREIRYDYFGELKEKQLFSKLITAHHKADVLETFFINLYRKSGISGLRSIPIKRDYVIRPFLAFTQEEITNYLAENKIAYRQDSSNTSLKYLRNTLRLEVLPLLEEKLVGFSKRANASIELLTKEEEAFNHLLSLAIDKLTTKENGRLSVAKNDLLTYPQPSVILYRILDKYGFNSAQCEQIVAATANESGQQFESSTHQLLVDRLFVFVQKKGTSINESTLINGPGIYKNSLGILKIEPESGHSFNGNKLEELVDLSSLDYPLVLKTWEKGEIFQPLGMVGHKLLSDFYIDQKIDNQLKAKTPILCSGNEVLWVVGHRISDKIKGTSLTINTKISFTFE